MYEREPITFGKHTAADAKARASINPCVNEFGRGPNDRQCRSCAYLRQGAANTRCGLRARHRHRADWPACEMYKHQI